MAQACVLGWRQEMYIRGSVARIARGSIGSSTTKEENSSLNVTLYVWAASDLV